jgi:hypothetical protein
MGVEVLPVYLLPVPHESLLLLEEGFWLAQLNLSLLLATTLMKLLGALAV